MHASHNRGDTAEQSRRSRASAKGQSIQQDVGPAAKDIHDQVCRETVQAKANMPNGSVKPRILPLTSKGDKSCMA